MDFICFEEPCSPRKTDIKVEDRALPTYRAVEVGMALSNLVTLTARYEYTHMIRVPEIFFVARKS